MNPFKMIPFRIPNLINFGSNSSETKIERTAGIDGDISLEKTATLRRPTASEEHWGQPGCGIRIGRTRINNRENLVYGAGTGPAGATACSMVDMYCGLDSVHKFENKMAKVPVNPNAENDAGRFFLSENCNVDDQFMCADGTIGNIKNKSAAVMKADQCRIIAREGIKIITGTDKRNSRGKKIISVPPIDLIAGNVPTDMLQPVVRGKNLEDALKALVDRINQVTGIVNHMLQTQQKFNSVLAMHTHPDNVAEALGICAAGERKAFMGGQTRESWDCMMEGFYNMCDGLRIKKDLMFHKGAMAGFQLEHLNPSSPKYINSRQVSTS